MLCEGFMSNNSAFTQVNEIFKEILDVFIN